MRYLLDTCNVYNIDVWVVSLDQEKAFDRVNHSFLFSNLRAFEFGDVFLFFVTVEIVVQRCLFFW